MKLRKVICEHLDERIELGHLSVEAAFERYSILMGYFYFAIHNSEEKTLTYFMSAQMLDRYMGAVAKSWGKTRRKTFLTTLRSFWLWTSANGHIEPATLCPDVLKTHQSSAKR